MGIVIVFSGLQAIKHRLSISLGMAGYFPIDEIVIENSRQDLKDIQSFKIQGLNYQVQIGVRVAVGAH